jgi:hypothetical protein
MIQTIALISSAVTSQIKTLRISQSATSTMAESNSSFFTFLQTNQYSMIALGCILLVTTCCLCCFYRRWKQRRVSKSSCITAHPTFKTSSSKSHNTNQASSNLNYATETSTATSNSSFTHNSEYSQIQTMSITLAPDELGNFVSLYTF